jgi:hypothetical protein
VFTNCHFNFTPSFCKFYYLNHPAVKEKKNGVDFFYTKFRADKKFPFI